MIISICLTNLGSLNLTSNVNIYSNVDGFTTPIYTNLPVTNLYGSNCSFTATVPDGTTILEIVDPILNCSTQINVVSSDFCADCNLRFDVFSSNTVSQIVAGLLIDDCSGSTITDYVIDWYGPNSTTNVQYTSGYGTEFTGFSFTHPLTGTQAIFAQSGSFFPQVRFIKINGIVYSQAGGAGSVLADINTCLSANTINVSPFDCTNGVSSKPQYTHEVNFSAQANGIPPIALDATFELSSTTKYFWFAFKSFEIPDTLTLTFSGSAYSDPIVIESIKTGTGYELQNPPFANATFLPSVVTKSAATWSQGYIAKVLCLTGLTINNGDKITINITPNQNNFETDWSLFFNGCSTSFDCDHCFANTNPSFKLSGSTIQMVTGDCNTRQIKYALSGCSDAYFQTDFFNGYFFGNTSQLGDFSNPYTIWTSPGIGSLTPSGIGQVNGTPNFALFNTNCYRFPDCDNFSCIPFCSTSNNNYIRYVKNNSGVGGTGRFEMYFSDVNDFNFYYNKITSAINFLLNQCDPLYVNDPSKSEYFKYFVLKIPINVSGNVECGDGNIPKDFLFHITTQITTGFTSYYELKLTMPTIVSLVPPLNCSSCKANCDFVASIINSSSTGVTNIYDFVTNRGSRYANPIEKWYVTKNITSQFENTIQWYLYVPRYINETYMYSGTPLTLIPSLTAQTCDLDAYMYYQQQDLTKNNHFYKKILFSYIFYILEQLKNIVRINSNGSIDTSLVSNYGFDSQVEACVIQSDGKIICVGSFTSYNFTLANRIIRLNSDGSVDNTFLTNIGSGATQPVFTVALQSDGRIIIGGNFSSFNGSTANRVARLNTDGTTDLAFLTNIGVGFNSSVTEIKIQSDDKLVCIGNFTMFNGSNKYFLTRLTSGGTNDATFTYTTSLNSNPTSIDIQSDGKIVVGGNFTSFGGTPTNRFLRLLTGGTLDTTFATNLGIGFNKPVQVVKVQTNGDILVGGDFTSFNGTNVNRLIRLTTTGSVDSTFLTNIGTGILKNNNPSCFQGAPFTIVQQTDGKIVVGGNFTIFNSLPLSKIFRLNVNGTIDSSFNIGNGFNSNGSLLDIQLQTTGEIVAVGTFNAYDTYPNNLNNFGIATYSIVDGNIVGSLFKIYEYSGGTVTYSDPTYIV
jgi:uncharacterized delta-60 repeat protein